jgi:hypothetical protein
MHKGHGRWGWALAAVLCLGCGGGGEEAADGKGKGKGKGPRAEKPTSELVEIAGPAPALLIGQAHFSQDAKPLPAKLVLLRTQDGKWGAEEISDPESNVFHKAIAWQGGILTIGAEAARLKHWTKGADGAWTAKTLWAPKWNGKFNRLRDLEIGDVTGDGQEDLVIATHDEGVVAVGQQGADGAWTFAEYDQRPDTFVHEIELGDVDGDGKKEIYATPSARNNSSGESQPGSVWRYDCDAATCKHEAVVDFTKSHAKEILVRDVDGDGKDELYVVREGVNVKQADGSMKLEEPVSITRHDRTGGAWKETKVAQIQDHQTRFLVPGDVDGDGKTDLVAAGFKSGLWFLKPKGDGTFEAALIDKNSSGFEHATHVADLDGDGKLEIYVAADDQREFRVYRWNGTGWGKTRIAPIGPASENFLTWNIQNGTL